MGSIRRPRVSPATSCVMSMTGASSAVVLCTAKSNSTLACARGSLAKCPYGSIKISSSCPAKTRSTFWPFSSSVQRSLMPPKPLKVAGTGCPVTWLMMVNLLVSLLFRVRGDKENHAPATGEKSFLLSTVMVMKRMACTLSRMKLMTSSFAPYLKKRR